MSAFGSLSEFERTRIWPGVVGRLVKGRNLTVGIVELDPSGLVPEHHHAQEQIGFVIEGTLHCRCGVEERDLGPGDTYRFADDQPHELKAGSGGAIVADLFAPPRTDWDALETMPASMPRWPRPQLGETVLFPLEGLIVRTWSARATPAGADNYRRYFAEKLLPQLRELQGFAGGHLLGREFADGGGIVELTTHTLWQSAQSIHDFAGPDITVSVVEPEAQAFLLDFDATATHRSVWIDGRT